MTHFVLRPESVPQVGDAIAEGDAAIRQIRRLVGRMAIATLILMAIGSATRVMNAGLACPDWPLCYGTLFPGQQMNLQVFLEWFHRLDAAFLGLSAITLVGFSLWQRRHLPTWVPKASGLALGLIVFQGVLGGLTVTEMLRFDIVTAHLGTALLFFVTLLVMWAMLTPHQGVGTAGNLPWVSLLAAVLVYVQSLLGALVGSQWAAHQCLSQSGLCTVLYSHLVGVVPPTLATLAVVAIAWRTPALHPVLRRWALLAGGCLGLQLLLGLGTLYLHLQVEPLTVAHQSVGALLLGSLVGITVLGWRDRVSDDPIPADAALLSGANPANAQS
ncbi:heme A synthase [Geitlerinema sp. PCC 7407]|uniref:COX15/CtaA family protein n=1 Tax=Geitlerinema sp. PCC 7407 TaxID=1173025 RepID=UPI00029FB815|nr:heme A synthase [Geitlerinema sp. PCC 7407]AFY64759.1 cytochrome oxidase assembly [Geitlerinema sp. PCC 7407]